MNYSKLIEQLKTEHNFLVNEDFQPAESGTVHKVFLSEKYVVRARAEDGQILKNEAKLLEEHDSPLMPKVLAQGALNGFVYMIENRLLGKNIDSLWKDLGPSERQSLIKDAVEFLRFLRTQKEEKIYSVRLGKNFPDFYAFLTDGLDEKISTTKEKMTDLTVLDQLVHDLDSETVKNLFAKSQTTLVHGDLVFHNLLTDGARLTGVIDWERALYGDPDYDIFRLMNFQISARTYAEQGQDQEDEKGYLEELLGAIQTSGLIENQDEFLKKYKAVRAYYFINALFWDVNSRDVDENIKETIEKIKLSDAIYI